MTSRYGLSIYSIHRATLFLSVRQGRCPRAMFSTSEDKRQPHELIDCAAADRLIRTSVVAGSDLDVARVMGVLDATVSVPAAEPLLGRPAVEGIAPFPRYNRSQNDLHGEVPFVSIRTAIGL